MTQADLATASGIDQPNISAIENGHRAPSADTLHRLVSSCGYVLAAVAGGQVVMADPLGDAVSTEPPRPMTMDERVRAMVAVLEVSDAIVRAR
jgi:transcriptional regulator with XRE-family HTH domain